MHVTAEIQFFRNRCIGTGLIQAAFCAGVWGWNGTWVFIQIRLTFGVKAPFAAKSAEKRNLGNCVTSLFGKFLKGLLQELTCTNTSLFDLDPFK